MAITNNPVTANPGMSRTWTRPLSLGGALKLHTKDSHLSYSTNDHAILHNRYATRHFEYSKAAWLWWADQHLEAINLEAKSAVDREETRKPLVFFRWVTNSIVPW